MENARMFTAIIEPEGKGYISFCPEFDIACLGNSFDEARTKLLEAVERFLETASLAEIKGRYRDRVTIERIELPCPRAAHLLKSSPRPPLVNSCEERVAMA